VQLGQELDLIDFDAAAKVSGTKFYYLKIVNFIVRKLKKAQTV